VHDAISCLRPLGDVMRLSLTFPKSQPWIIKQAPNEQFAAILPAAPSEKLPQAVVTYGPIIVKPDEPRRWQEQVARSDAPPGSKVVFGRTHELSTAVGWPLRLVEVTIQNANGETIEARLCAFFTFMEHAAAAIVRAANPG